MASPPPFSANPEQRRLAAIVFTDVSGFSARMQVEETSTLELLERDFEVMRTLSAEHSGTVLKSTGDGLLLCFASAVQAVTWALSAQRHFAERARASPVAENFRHRMGIHLGDVFFRADDVMGDGVNIAARVQAQAPPGGICISQTVYDVVNNKMELHVIRLEPRKLKNIRDVVQMYHVLLERPAPRPPPRDVPPTPTAPAPSRRRMPVGVLLLLAIGIGTVLVVHQHTKVKNDRAAFEATHAALGALLSEKNGKAGVAPEMKSIAGETASPVSAPRAELEFAKLTTREPAAADAPAFPQARAAVEALNTWMSTELARYTGNHPLPIRALRGSLPGSAVFTDPDRRLCFAEGGAQRPADWDRLRAEVQAAIVVSALVYSPQRAPRAVMRGAEAFAYLHGLPEMADALSRERQRRGDSSL